jgi:putative endonuclease
VSPVQARLTPQKPFEISKGFLFQIMFTLYILYSQNFKKSYVGQTQNLQNRLLEHNETATKGFTIPYRPWTLIYNELFPTRSDVLKREKFLKTWAGRIEVKKIIDNYLQNPLGLD